MFGLGKKFEKLSEGGITKEKAEHDAKITAAMEYIKAGKWGKMGAAFLKQTPEKQNEMLEEFIKKPPMNADWNDDEKKYEFAQRTTPTMG